MISDNTPSRRARKMSYAFEAISGGGHQPKGAEVQQKPSAPLEQVQSTDDKLSVQNQQVKNITPQHNEP